MKVLIISGDYPLPAITYAELLEKYGNNIEIYTPEQARIEGLGMNDFGNTHEFTIPYKPNPMLLEPIHPLVITASHYYKSGKESRRERRARERKNKKR